jgi:ribosome-binding factor A
MPSVRCQKVADLLQREIGGILQRGLKDPGIGFVTVTEVEMSPDLRNARVYVSVYGDEARKRQALEALDRARPYIQSQVGQHVRLRFAPVLHFRLDTSVEYGAKIEALLNRLKDEKDRGGPETQDPETEA